jgi:predicted P-loop ATPase
MRTPWPAIRDQLWAEAKARFEAGSVWWLDTAELIQLASDQQVDRYEGDPWEEVIAPWLETRSSVSISEVLEKCLAKPQASGLKPTRSGQRGACEHKAGNGIESG